MKIGIFSDPHITRKISYLPDRYYNIIDTFREIYKVFINSGVDIVVCCGDLFDKSRLLAIDTKLVSNVLSIMSMRETYVLSGNHDIGNDDSSLIDLLDLVDNLIPISEVYSFENLVFVPYGKMIPDNIKEGSILFTHDEFSGMTINSLGIQSKSKNTIDNRFTVFNGHIHLPSLYGNILNVGSVLPSKFGEMRFGDSINIYVYDTETKVIETHPLKSPYRFYIIDQKSVLNGSLEELYDREKICLRIDYTDDDFYKEYGEMDWSDYRYVTFRKVLPESLSSDVMLSSKSEVQKINVPDFIESRISKDSTISDTMRQSLLSEYPGILVEEV